jgi:predicted ribosomally synthesized peptide with SipW-like signal peptide
MDTKMLTAILVIGLVATMAGAGTYAYFSSARTSTDNTFTAGTLDLKVSHSSLGPWTDGVTGTWTLANMKPGDETPTASVFFKNSGSVASSTMEITCSYTVTEETPQTASDTDPHTDQHPDEMAKYMIITMVMYRNDKVDIDCLTGHDSYSGQTKNEWKINDANGDGKISLYELKLDPLINLPSPDTQPNKITQLDMRIKFDENAGNDFQGDTFNLTMIFTLHQ